MAKKQEDQVVQGGILPQVDIIEQKSIQGMKYLDKFMPNDQPPNSIPNHIQTAINPWVRNKRKEFDVLTEIIETSDKASDEYSAAAREREKIASAMIMGKSLYHQ